MHNTRRVTAYRDKMSITEAIALNNHSPVGFADLSIRKSWGAAPRLLDILQGWARRRMTGEGRGAVYLLRRTWLDFLGVTTRTLQRVIKRLVDAGWIRATWVVDDFGREVEGFEVALESRAGFVGGLTSIDRQLVLELSPTSFVERNEDQTNEIGAAQASRPRPEPTKQATLFELEPERPQLDPEFAKREAKRERTEAARRIAAHERKRYSEHPRCTRAKRSDAKSMAIAVEAIESVLESGVQEVEAVAAIELQWARAVDDEDSWRYWTGVELWKGRKLAHLLAWLEEPRNAVYLRIAEGLETAPTRDTLQAVAAEAPVELADLLEDDPALDEFEADLFRSAASWLPSAAWVLDHSTGRLTLEGAARTVALELERRGEPIAHSWIKNYLVALARGHARR